MTIASTIATGDRHPPVGAESSAATPRAALVERDYDDGAARWRGRLDSGHRLDVHVTGKGTMPGAHAMVAFLDEVVAALGEGGTARFHYDITGVRGAPLRAQLLFGRWFMRHRAIVERGAIVSTSAFERGFASAVCGIAGVRNVRFFERDADARAWLAEGRS